MGTTDSPQDTRRWKLKLEPGRIRGEYVTVAYGSSLREGESVEVCPVDEARAAVIAELREEAKRMDKGVRGALTADDKWRWFNRAADWLERD